jgi:nitroreductase/NAD-dependent dihydropyrimidine dehydrogenase PreA subunit
MISIDPNKCTRCGACNAVCPAIVIEIQKESAVPVYPQSCIQCYHCVAVCPVDAVSCTEFPLSEFKSVGKSMPTPAAMRNQLLSRRSVREFKDKPVSREILDDLVRVASHAPTGHNAQSVELCVITDKELINGVDMRIVKLFDSMLSVIDNPVAENAVKLFGGSKMGEMLMTQKNDLKRFKAAPPPRNFHVFRNAPVLMIAHSGADAVSGKDDCVIALSHAMMMANSLGLGATWIGYLVGMAKFDPTLKKKFGVPAKNALNSAIIVGWPKYKYKKIVPRQTVGVKWIGPR